MAVFKLDEWTVPKLEGFVFAGLDLGNYDVAKELSPLVQRAMHEVERLDQLVTRVVLDGEVLRAVAEDGETSHEMPLPDGLLDSLRKLSASPPPPWPLPEPSAEVAARLDKLDEILFSPHGMGLVGRVFMHAATYCDVRRWQRVRLDIITDATLLKSGWMATLYHPMFNLAGAYANGMTFEAGRPIWVSRLVPLWHVHIDKREGQSGPLAGALTDNDLIPLERT
jgi:hypothetical protein